LSFPLFLNKLQDTRKSEANNITAKALNLYITPLVL
jgi:hypothetical protein